MKERNPLEAPRTLTERLWYLRYHEDRIRLRVRRGRRWVAVTVAQLTPKEWAEFMALNIVGDWDDMREDCRHVRANADWSVWDLPGVVADAARGRA